VGFVVDKVALGHFFSEYFGFPCQSSFHQFLYNHHNLSGAGTIGQSGRSTQNPTAQIKKNYVKFRIVEHRNLETYKRFSILYYGIFL
jgi:hypothetical protein